MTFQSFQVLQRGSEAAAGMAAGGPYKKGDASDLLVGDLWVLAGQSNMEGVGNLANVEEPSPWVHSFQSREEWAVAEEPTHYLDESPRFVHHRLRGRTEIPEFPAPRSRPQDKGASLGVAFGKSYHSLTEIPVGLIPCAHGGTTMEQWNPALKDQGGNSLYGAALERFRRTGSSVTGVLWYQGESDAHPGATKFYAARMEELIRSFRADFSSPDLPFYLVQIGRFVSDAGPDSVEGWNIIREAQRLISEMDAHTGVVSAIDLELDDQIHISTNGLKRLGRRLALLAAGGKAPTLRGARWEGQKTLRVGFDNLQGGFDVPGRPSGFSLRDQNGKLMPLIYKTTLEGDEAVLHLSDFGPIRPSELRLWYGYGLNPYCNLIDTADQGVPAFGPLALPSHP